MFQKSKRIEVLGDRCAKLEKDMKDIYRLYEAHSNGDKEKFKFIFNKISEFDDFIKGRASLIIKDRRKLTRINPEDIF